MAEQNIPIIGERRHGRELGYKSKGSNYIWQPCLICGEPRWAACNRYGKPRYEKCISCSSGDKSLLNIKPPSAGEIRKGYSIQRRHCIDDADYIWHSCITCGFSRWVYLRSGKPLNLRCHDCVSKTRKPRVYDINTSTPYVGEVRPAIELGKISSGKFIYILCAKCGKGRWVQLNKKYQPKYCVYCLRNRIDYSDLRKLYEDDKLSTSQIAKLKGTEKSTIRWALLRKGIKTRSASEAQKMLIEYKYRPSNAGVAHPNWKGGRIRTGRGDRRYIEVKIFSDNPYYCMANKMGYVMEHRLLMAQHLNRPLLKSEHVHHVNGDTQDNRVENLQVLTSDDHNIRTMICVQCNLRQEVKLLRWQIKQQTEQIQLLLKEVKDGRAT